ncbi:hypothetical protein FS837_005912 [Tulasnella sp. UAMH 9824]|nr:hypothetical protein FS837_005912 [Tulasnella sp. UAMH 9824]
MWKLKNGSLTHAPFTRSNLAFQNKSGSGSEFKTTEVHVDISGDIIRFVKPDTPLEQDKEKGNYVHPFVKARIVFEPLS